ncbi:MAG: ATP-binding cassette domain-containing protein [Firmicutes bacterium]|nr:ATP-binding cassette domain-containing protein [Bacillota bacterium]
MFRFLEAAINSKINVGAAFCRPHIFLKMKKIENENEELEVDELVYTNEDENEDENDSILEVGDLVLGYDGKAITGEISFGINEGDYLCIIGDNGTGKSTLLKTILALHKPISGWMDLVPSRKEIGYLPQQNAVQKDFPSSVFEVAITGTLSKNKWWMPFYSKEQKEDTKKALEATNSLDLTDKCYRELSGGQQQRVLLSRALLASKNMIFLDEPTASLDIDASCDFYETLKKINLEKNTTIVMVTHDIENALKHSTHILDLKKDGFFFGTTKEYQNN